MKNVKLSHREKEVLLFLASGLTEQEVADKFFISKETVHTHVKNIYKILGAHSVVEAMGMAIYFDCITVGEWFVVLLAKRTV